MEYLALQGFPPNFKFKGISLNDAYKQCGNTVCVPILKGIAERIFYNDLISNCDQRKHYQQ